MSAPDSMNQDITVVVTCFNDGRFLPEALASAIEQEGGKPQLIVVDDGSTDHETLRALERATADAQLIRQANAGPAVARNTGLAAAQTRYLIALDADDRLAPAALRHLREPLDRDPKLGFSYGLTRFFGQWEGTLAMPEYDPYKLLYRSLVGSTALMQRELLADVGGFDPAFSGYEDWEFWLHALAKGWQGQQVQHETLFYRRHGTSRHTGARGNYRIWYQALRRKHHRLYERAQRRQFAAESDLGPVGRAVYRWWWGPRPLPAKVEVALHAWLWRPNRQRRGELMTDGGPGTRIPASWHITPETLDIALRYERLLALIKDRYHRDLRILELGSGSGGVAEFLDHRVTGVDTAFDRTADRFSDRLVAVEADATDVPLGDAEFDVVVSVDMFEHLSATARISALSEMLRLLAPGGRMIVGFPAGPVAAKLDRRLNDSFADHHGRPHPWALEHIEHGLPDPDEVEFMLRELAPAGATVRRYRHLWGPAWWAIGALYTIRLHETAARRLGLWTDPAARLIFALVKGLNHGGCYRTFFVVDKLSG